MSGVKKIIRNEGIPMTNSDKTQDLLPCPFCGDQQVFVEQKEYDCNLSTFYIVCRGCFCRTDEGNDAQTVTEFWHTRATPTVDDTARKQALDDFEHFMMGNVHIVSDLNTMVETILAALSAPTEIPDGWQIVPIEPTPEMIYGGCLSTIDFHPEQLKLIWSWMIAEAPKPTDTKDGAA